MGWDIGVQNRCITLGFKFCLPVKDIFDRILDFVLSCLRFKMTDRRVIISTMKLERRITPCTVHIRSSPPLRSYILRHFYNLDITFKNYQTFSHFPLPPNFTERKTDSPKSASD
jgi:hypothetical protein